MSESTLQPQVSCVMATRDRRVFLEVALRCYRRQDFTSKELIVVDDGLDPVEDLIPSAADFRYLRVAHGTPLGEKLNLGIQAARGEIIQKIDDDDYYKPAFLSQMVKRIVDCDPTCSVAALDCFHVLVVETGHLTHSGHGWSAGHSLCFSKQLWRKRQFRCVSSAEDWWFLEDHAARCARICNADLSMVVRHPWGHTWTTLGGQPVTEYFERRTALHRRLAGWLPPEDAAYYAALQTRAARRHT